MHAELLWIQEYTGRELKAASTYQQSLAALRTVRTYDS
jgi:hypothetical protein